MLEILLLVFLCKRLGAQLRAKQRNPLGFQILLVVLWFGGEFFAGVIGALVYVGLHGAAPQGFQMPMYFLALVGGVCGAGITFGLARLMPHPNEEIPDQLTDSIPPVAAFPPPNSDNPYAAQSTVVETRRGQSRLGLASVVLAVLNFVGLCVLFVVAGVIATSNPDFDEQSTEAIVTGLVFLCIVALNLLGLFLGIVALFRRYRSQVAAIVGIVLHLLTILVFGALTAFGIALGE